MLIRRRNWSRKATTVASAELSSHTSSFCFNHNKLQLFALALCAPLPTRQKTSLSSLIYKHKFACFCRAGALVCVVQATAPCCCEAATQAKWHNKRNAPIYASVECCPPLRGRRGFPFKGERRCGRDALSNTSCECVVAKANEADCFANAEVQTPEERGTLQ